MSAPRPLATAAANHPLDRTAIRLSYWWRHGRLPALDEPRLFTEWVQHRKLHDRNRLLPLLADKVAVKAWVAAQLGADWIIPTLWHGADLPAAAPWSAPFVLKARHGCNQTRVVTDPAAQWAGARHDAARWMRRRYGAWLSEWLYGDIPRGVLVEPYVGTGATLPVDYKLFVFGGAVRYVQVHLGRGRRHRWIVFDRDWRRLSPSSADAPTPPASLARMIAGAERLGAAFPFVRVDLYDGDAGPLFGEMTFYPGSGLDPFDPVALDALMGLDWRRAVASAGTVVY